MFPGPGIGLTGVFISVDTGIEVRLVSVVNGKALSDLVFDRGILEGVVQRKERQLVESFRNGRSDGGIGIIQGGCAADLVAVGAEVIGFSKIRGLFILAVVQEDRVGGPQNPGKGIARKIECGMLVAGFAAYPRRIGHIIGYHEPAVADDLLESFAGVAPGAVF